MTTFIKALLAATLLSQPVFAQDVRPGPTPPTVSTAAVMFGQACVDNLPDFAISEQLIENSGVFRRAETGTYYHQTYNLSIKVHVNNGQLACSLVFFNNNGNARIAAELVETMARIRNDHAAANPNASFETLSADGDSTGFHRFAIFMNPN